MDVDVCVRGSTSLFFLRSIQFSFTNLFFYFWANKHRTLTMEKSERTGNQASERMKEREKNFSHYKLIIVIVYCDADDARTDKKNIAASAWPCPYERTVDDTPVGRFSFSIHDNIISSNLSNNSRIRASYTLSHTHTQPTPARRRANVRKNGRGSTRETHPTTTKQRASARLTRKLVMRKKFHRSARGLTTNKNEI